VPALEPRPVAAHGRPVALPPVVDATIAELVVAAQSGNRDAFASLYQRFHRAVHAVALSRVGAVDAADVVQDVFVRAWQRLDAIREPAAFAGWLMTMARHRAIDRARARTPVHDPSADLAVSPAPTSEAAAALRAIRDLPEAYRETLLMRLVEGLTGPEIAVQTGLTPESVRVNLHRGMKLLRERLGGGSP
jgi:RNA polymerase sigma-70 factor, ECF subfamily